MQVGRRRALQVAGALCALPFLSPLAAGGRGSFAARGRGSRGQDKPAGPFDAFTDLWWELEGEYLGPEAREDAYLYRLAAEAQALAPADVPEMQRTVFENERLTTGPAWTSGSIFAVVVRMAPGAVLAPHDHPGHVVVTMGLEGSARYRHYELEDEAPAKDDRDTPFLVRETRSGLLVPGCTTHLSRTRDNVHAFTAGPEGAVLVDFTTAVGGPDFGMLAVDEQAEDEFHGLRVARWREVAF